MDSLDTVEQTSPEPEAQPFSQRVEEPAVEPTPEPQQVEKPAAQEPEPPPVEPDWLNTPREPEPQRQPQQQYQEPYYPPQQQPQYQQQRQQPVSQSALDRFLENPDQWGAEVAQRVIEQYAGPINQQTAAMQYQMQAIRDTFTKTALSQADGAIRNAYGTLNKDRTFRSNKGVQQMLNNTLKNMRDQAMYAAQRGDFEPLQQLAGLDATRINAALAAARVMSGAQGGGVEPMQVEGATVEGSRAQANPGSNVELSAEQQEIAKRLGREYPGYESRMRKAAEDAAKYDDFEG